MRVSRVVIVVAAAQNELKLEPFDHRRRGGGVWSGGNDEGGGGASARVYKTRLFSVVVAVTNSRGPWERGIGFK